MNRIEKAELIARRQHKNQSYGNVSYVEGHLELVVERVQRLSSVKYLTDQQLEDLQIVAWLHDVIEDTDYTPEELEAVFGANIREAVCLLTKTKKETYMSYLLGLARSNNLLSVLVKYADMSCNKNECGKFNLHSAAYMKYKMGNDFLEAYFTNTEHTEAFKKIRE